MKIGKQGLKWITGQGFYKNPFKGEWLTNSKYDKNKYAIFQEISYTLFIDNRYVLDELKKDGIFIYFDKSVTKGRLTTLNKKEIAILWGDKEPKERIKYYRPLN
ncbi:hypothetical protein J4050_07785 [Winogradskyella sp. DF17]|uniref:Uncharacterized protein n=1 Tax=Winogradskyella pelagia TaxID=2819984 RepID=A0ABS3T1L4_9FLAO|nr:hypothetical protein [Winogradskyella sp. DF17]MBO3116641.1 hypothetical protein [Winogradskyella sp. DF17]